MMLTMMLLFFLYDVRAVRTEVFHHLGMLMPPCRQLLQLLWGDYFANMQRGHPYRVGS